MKKIILLAVAMAIIGNVAEARSGFVGFGGYYSGYNGYYGGGNHGRFGESYVYYPPTPYYVAPPYFYYFTPPPYDANGDQIYYPNYP
jgi:hypothetical protein